jgi:replicative DNA helicase
MKPGVHLVIRAEQALLGSVLADPDRQARLLDLVDTDDMTRPYHGQVLGAMNRVRGRGAGPTRWRCVRSCRRTRTCRG